ncbi:MAG: GTP 3',8-cyclase MoaA [Saprospiraceae bacterium]|nr:GTP 3',8-cyclase MoaA [Pyrinomonadaceae bacterium]
MMFSDRFNRVITYLRISVTERCNFRCIYCMPAEGIALVPKVELLSFEEIARVVSVGAKLGLSKIRLTGGEPTIRHDLPELVAMISDIDGINEIAMTTNGARLSELAKPLRQAGLSRINISLDTLRPDRSVELTRRDLLPAVLKGADDALAAGFTPLKFNAVVLRGINDDELCDLASFAHERGSQMRFIEYMPMGSVRTDERNRTVTMREMLERLRERFDLVPEPGNLSDPARGWVCRRSGARIGFITSMSEHFCDSCNRMRLTAEGGLRPCLHQNAEVDLKSVIRGGGDDNDVEDAFKRAADLKWAGHQMNAFVPIYSSKDMLRIGG